MIYRVQLNVANSVKDDSSGGNQIKCYPIASFLTLTLKTHENNYEFSCNGGVMLTSHYQQFLWTNCVKFSGQIIC